MNKYKICFGLGGVVLFLDQVSKFWIERNIPLWSSKEIVPGFLNLVHILNKGAAFGFLNRADISWQTYFFIAVSALAIVLIVHLLRTVSRKDYFLFVGLGLILGGALGNLIDRIRLGKVIDFLDFYISSYHWPAFNVADMAIFCGTVCLMLSFYKRKKHASHSS
ncbi:MAG: signal peptidase II [Desulfonauticus sp.]|nr:signal peptidase II [Desulfonauticus sp.]